MNHYAQRFIFTVTPTEKNASVVIYWKQKLKALKLPKL